jgi:hypothetical protein
MSTIKVVEQKNQVKVNAQDITQVVVEEVRNYVDVTESGPQGATGPKGDKGDPGLGIPAAGLTGQVLTKSSNTNYATTWSNAVSSIIAGNGLTGGTITTSGTIAINTSVVAQLGVSQIFTGSQTLTPSNASSTALIVKGVTSQSAELMVIKSSTDSVIAKIDANGGIFATTLSTLNGYVKISEENSGGLATFTKQSGVPSNPGSDKAGVYFRAGSTAGTLRLSIVAGSAGEEITVVDDIPQTGGANMSRLGLSIIEGGNA